jgi:RNA polymerase sigma-70 factor (ECF subfamily)
MPGSALGVPREEIRHRIESDERELSAVASRHGRSLLGYVKRLTGDHQLAEDIVQETLLRAWRTAPAGEARDGALRPWLFRVARNLATDLHRARRARPREVAIDAAADVPATKRVDRSLQVREIVDGLRALRPEHRLAIVEVYFRGHSVAEAADILGVPAGTVKSRCYYGLRALRRELERRGVVR